MPLKRRRPKERTVVITPRALEVFRAMQFLDRKSDEWYAAHEVLHKELGCRPWEYPLDSRNGTYIWTALEDALEVAERRQLETVAAK
jgi:hypothetical protein